MLYRSDLIEVRSSDLGGRGLFARAAIPAGTRIIREPLLIGLPDTFKRPMIIYEAYIGLPQGDQEEFMSLSVATGLSRADSGADEVDRAIAALPEEERSKLDVAEVHKVVAIFHTNAFECDAPADGGGPRQDLFLKMSRINHSCTPSATMNRDMTGLIGNIQVIRDVAADEEILLGYVPVCRPVAQRQKDLKSGWGFDCVCRACDMNSVAGKESERRRRMICAKVTEAALTLPQDAEILLVTLVPVYHETISLMMEEGIVEWEQGQFHHYLASIYSRAGQTVMAYVHEAKALQCARLCFGEDDVYFAQLQRKVDEYRNLLGLETGVVPDFG